MTTNEQVPAVIEAEDVDTDTTNDEILLAASNHDLDTLRTLFKTADARFKDPETGFSPLHAAIAACEPDDDEELKGQTEGHGDAVHTSALSEESALATVQLLFENGAIWNELDNNDETPGCIAHRLGLKTVYDAIVSAGVRAELLFGRLDAYQLLGDDEEDDEAEDGAEDDAIVGFEPMPSGPVPDHVAAATGADGSSAAEGIRGFEPTPNPSYKVNE